MNSKWSYIAVGVSAMGAFLGAVTHNGTFVIVNLLFVLVNWHGGERRRKLEDSVLLENAKTEDAQS